MKKLMATTIGVVLVMLMAFTLAGCGQEEAAVPEAAESTEMAASPEETFTIGYSCISWTIPWMVYYKDLFETEIAKYPNYEVIWHDAQFDFKAMADGLEDFIAQDVDLILHFALDSLPMLETYKKIQDAGIPLILTMDPPDYKAYDYMTAYSGLDTRDAGRQCALMLEEALGGEGNIAMITAPKGSSSELQYTAGFKNELNSLGSNLNLIAEQPGDWDITVAQNVGSDILTKYPDIDGFYISDDWMGGGLVRALKEKGYEPGQVAIAVAGGSKIGIKDFTDGWYLGIADQGPELCVYQDIFFLRSLLEDNAPLPHFAMVRQELITEENVDRFPGTW